MNEPECGKNKKKRVTSFNPHTGMKSPGNTILITCLINIYELHLIIYIPYKHIFIHTHIYTYTHIYIVPSCTGTRTSGPNGGYHTMEEKVK